MPLARQVEYHIAKRAQIPSTETISDAKTVWNSACFDIQLKISVRQIADAGMHALERAARVQSERNCMDLKQQLAFATT
eukprot:734297-Pleurochrysis_carterae.AAC.12